MLILFGVLLPQTGRSIQLYVFAYYSGTFSISMLLEEESSINVTQAFSFLTELLEIVILARYHSFLWTQQCYKVSVQLGS